MEGYYAEYMREEVMVSFFKEVELSPSVINLLFDFMKLLIFSQKTVLM